MRDGIQELVRCGDGTDRVDADTLDELDGDCEPCCGTLAAPPPGTTGVRDRVAPRLEVGAPARLRIGASRRVRLLR